MSAFESRRREFGPAEAYEWLLRLQRDAEAREAKLFDVLGVLREVQQAVIRLGESTAATAAWVRGEVDRLSQEIAAVTEDHEDLDVRFTKVLASRAAPESASTPAAATARHVEHQEIAERFRTFVDQELTSAARAAVLGAKRRRGRQPTEGELVAERLTELCRAMFAGPDIDESWLRVLLADAPEWAVRLASTGAELRWRARASTPQGAWSFDAPADGPVAAVLVPAYVVAGRVFEPQRFATQVQ